MEQMTFWGLEPDALRQLAQLLRVSVTETRGPGFAPPGRSALWAKELVSRLAELERNERGQILDLLEDILEEQAEAVLDSLIGLCRKAVRLDMRIMQVEPFL